MASARNVAGGVVTDNLVTGSTLSPNVLTCVYLRFNITALDATTRRPFDWSNGTVAHAALIVSNTGVLNYIGGPWATTAGNWTIVSPSTGAEHDLLVVYDANLTTNVPVIYLDGASVAVTTSTAPVGASTLTAQKITLGNRQDLTRPFNGWFSTVAVWSGVLLTSGNATSLHNGTAPCAIQPSFLAFYAPLERGDSPETELVTGNNLTVTGTTVVTGSSAFSNPRCCFLGHTVSPMIGRHYV